MSRHQAPLSTLMPLRMNLKRLRCAIRSHKESSLSAFHWVSALYSSSFWARSLCASARSLWEGLLMAPVASPGPGFNLYARYQHPCPRGSCSFWSRCSIYFHLFSLWLRLHYLHSFGSFSGPPFQEPLLIVLLPSQYDNNTSVFFCNGVYVHLHSWGCKEWGIWVLWPSFPHAISFRRFISHKTISFHFISFHCERK